MNRQDAKAAKKIIKKLPQRTPRAQWKITTRKLLRHQHLLVVLKGQSTSLRFDYEGTYGYICGLHPGMKGTIEVTK